MTHDHAAQAGPELSVAGRWSPAGRVLAASGAAAAVAAMPGGVWWAPIPVLAAVLLVDPRPRDLRSLALRLAPLAALVVTTLALLAAALAAGPGLRAVATGAVPPPVWLERSLLLLGKSVGVVLVLAWLGEGLTRRDLLQASEALHLPRSLRVVAYLGMLWAQGLVRQAREVQRALAARGRAQGLRRLRLATLAARALALRSLRRTDTVALALVARGFTGDLPLPEPAPSLRAEAPRLLIWTLLMGAMVWLAWWL